MNQINKSDRNFPTDVNESYREVGTHICAGTVKIIEIIIVHLCQLYRKLKYL